MIYAVPKTNPSAPATVFWPDYYEDGPLYWQGFGIDPASIKPYFGVVPNGDFGAPVGTPQQWVEGLSYEVYLAGGYSNPVVCAPFWLLPEWSAEASWSVAEAIGPILSATWSAESSWSANEASLAAYFGTWSAESSWSASEASLAAYFGTWSAESSWSASETVGPSVSAVWSAEASWSAVLATESDYSVGWSAEASWSVTEVTIDNVTSFTCGSLTATGTTQGTAAAIATDTVNLTTAVSQTGAILPAGCFRIVVNNLAGAGTQTAQIYPPTGAKINALATNAAFPMATNTRMMFVEVTATQWYTVAVA